MNHNPACGVLVFVAAHLCAAQTNTFLLKVSNTISPGQPSATVELWAVFDPSVYAMAYTMLDLLAAPDEGKFSDPVIDIKEGYCGILTLPGEVDPHGDSIGGIYLFQTNWFAGCFAAPDNPYLILSYTWSTEDFTPRIVDLSTSTASFALYLHEYDSEVGDFLNDDFAEGRGQIVVVPAPGGAVLLAMCAVLGGRRMR